MKKLLLICCITTLLRPAYAQFSGDNTKTLGDRAFRNKDYFEAAYYYKKAAEGMNIIGTMAIPYQATKKTEKKSKGKEADRAYICYQLGESYRGYENYIEAEGWYNRVLTEGFETEYPLARVWHGVCLRAIQKFDDAIKDLEQFKSSYKGESKYIAMADKEIDNCNFAKQQYQYPVLVDAGKKKGNWNSDGSDYAVIKKDDNYWFTSSRFVGDDKKHLNRLYSAGTGTVKPTVLTLKDNSNVKELEYGTAALDPTGKRMYFTRWYKEGSKTTHAIYITEMSNGAWSEPQKLNSHINAEGFNAIQPFVTADGKQLYFVTNKPGGQGGDDIWISDLSSDGNPLNSTNLGKVINTEFNEQAPYYDVNSKRLIYSSKGFIGLGGFDFFESWNENGKWTVPQNMGYPVNSAKDDLYYMPDDDKGEKFFLSSDRESDCCLNIFEAYNKQHILIGNVIDCDTKKPLAGVKVSFIDSLSKKTIKQVTTNTDAKYAFDVKTRRPYSLKLEKDGYFAKILLVPGSGQMSNDTLFNPDICLQAFEIDKPIVIANVLYDYDKATLRPESKLVLNGLVDILSDNPQIRVELGAHTDSKGSDAYNDKLSQARAKACVDYIISRGISSTRIYAKGYGERRPIAPNILANGKDNPAGRQLNRRTEFKVLK